MLSVYSETYKPGYRFHVAQRWISNLQTDLLLRLNRSDRVVNRALMVIGLIRIVSPQLCALGNMLIKFLRMGKHESWEAVSLKWEREINFWAWVSPKISGHCGVICHVGGIPLCLHVISFPSLVSSPSMLSPNCHHTLLNRHQGRSLRQSTSLLLWSQLTALSKFYHIYISAGTDYYFHYWLTCWLYFCITFL